MCDENNNKPLNMAPKPFLLLALAFAVVILIAPRSLKLRIWMRVSKFKLFPKSLFLLNIFTFAFEILVFWNVALWINIVICTFNYGMM